MIFWGEARFPFSVNAIADRIATTGFSILRTQQVSLPLFSSALVGEMHLKRPISMPIICPDALPSPSTITLLRGHLRMTACRD